MALRRDGEQDGGGGAVGLHERRSHRNPAALATTTSVASRGKNPVSTTPDGKTGVAAQVTPQGFRLLGTAPSARGPCFRATVCYKFYDGLRNFQRHPSEPTVGHGELIWHYDQPTWLYPLFETKINKPLKKEFASLVAFYYKDRAWHFDVTVNKTEAAGQ